jgi:hypothetical protein
VSCISHDDDGTLDRRCGAKMVIRRCPLVAWHFQSHFAICFLAVRQGFNRGVRKWK